MGSDRTRSKFNVTASYAGLGARKE